MAAAAVTQIEQDLTNGFRTLFRKLNKKGNKKEHIY